MTFFLCLVTLTVTFLCFGIYIRSHLVKDADFTKDFDTVLQTLSTSKICPQRNVSAPPAALGLVQGSSIIAAPDLGNVSVLASVTLSPWQPSGNHSGLQIRATAGQLGMKGPGTDSHLLVTVTSSWWSAQCNESDSECSAKYCVIVTGPQSALPLSWSSFQCSPSNHQLHPELYVVEAETDTPSKCYSLQYRGDPHLKAMISPEDRARSSGRLLFAVIFCLLAALLLLVVSTCLSHPIKDKRTPGAL